MMKYTKYLTLLSFVALSVGVIACGDETIGYSDNETVDNSDETGDSDLCGNGKLDDEEVCDGDLLSTSATCPKGMKLKTKGKLKCKSDCTLDTSACIKDTETPKEEAKCGNGKLDDDEICDGDEISSTAVCPDGTSLKEGSSMTCRDDCTLDTSNCQSLCGNGQIDEGEMCDSDDMPDTASCPEGMVLKPGTALTCSDSCSIDTSNCEVLCGNGQIDEGEMCDGDGMPETASCPEGMGLKPGTALICTDICTIDTSNCEVLCGNGRIDDGEECDGNSLPESASCPAGLALPPEGSLSCTNECKLDISACEEPCKTRIEYGSTWLHDTTNHPNWYDNAAEKVTWDGKCIDDGSNSYAVLSNGWKPYFSGHSCLIALDYTGSCGEDNTCKTRVTYGDNWYPGTGHENYYYDDATYVITWNGTCPNNVATLSNGWKPAFKSACKISLRYTQCGGLFINPVYPSDAPDPGVILDNGTYYMVSTGGYYPLKSSTDLIHWENEGYAFSNAATAPSWGSEGFWAPEIHKVGDKYNIYFSAKNNLGSNKTNQYCIGVGTSDKVTGPYDDLGKPLLCKNNMGVIDASFFEDIDGKRYLLWKDDGNAVGKKTPVFIQELTSDGRELTGTPTQILTNDQAWEGSLIEGPWMIKRGSYYYLFYSGNGYTSPNYAIGVARSTSVKGPFTKYPEQLIKREGSNGYFQGPGHGSVLQSPSGEWFHIYHTWTNGYVGYNTGGPGRVIAVDRIYWIDDWPMSYSAPLHRSQPPIK